MNNLIVKTCVELMERGWMPENFTRSGIQKLCRQRLSELNAAANGVGHHASGLVPDLVTKARKSDIAPVPEKANEQHYEVPDDFYNLVLGPRLKYSCCYFEDSDSSLERAEEAALAITCERAEINDGMNILELGCGWGSLTLWMATHFRNCRITAVSNSNSQRKSIELKAKALGVSDRVRIITCDMNDFEAEGRFDRVVSVEMFEHMRNYEKLLERIAHWLEPNGKLFVHIFAHKEFAYEFETKGASNWMGQYFFTGGIMPSQDFLSHFNKDMRVCKTWTWDGTHYQKTCAAWRVLMEESRFQVMSVLESTYGRKNAPRWFNRWKMFFLAGEELFGYENGTQWQVNHYLFEHSQSTHHLVAQSNDRIINEHVTAS